MTLAIANLQLCECKWNELKAIFYFYGIHYLFRPIIKIHIRLLSVLLLHQLLYYWIYWFHVFGFTDNDKKFLHFLFSQTFLHQTYWMRKCSFQLWFLAPICRLFCFYDLFHCFTKSSCDGKQQFFLFFSFCNHFINLSCGLSKGFGQMKIKRFRILFALKMIFSHVTDITGSKTFLMIQCSTRKVTSSLIFFLYLLFYLLCFSVVTLPHSQQVILLFSSCPLNFLQSICIPMTGLEITFAYPPVTMTVHY